MESYKSCMRLKFKVVIHWNTVNIHLYSVHKRSSDKWWMNDYFEQDIYTKLAELVHKIGQQYVSGTTS